MENLKSVGPVRRRGCLRQFSLRTLVVVVVVAGTILGVGVSALQRLHRKKLVESCGNRAVVLCQDLSLANLTQLPYEPGLPGCEMLARAAKPCVKGGDWCNCRHGDPEGNWGGWQAVNLSPPQWQKLVERWQSEGGDDAIPFCWCGRPTGERRGGLETSDGKRLFPSLWEEENLVLLIDRMNSHLVAMGIAPVDLNIPNNVDWVQISRGSATPVTDHPRAPPSTPKEDLEP